MTITQFATLLAHAPMSDAERQCWVDLMPVLPQAVILELGECLEKEQKDIAKLRTKYMLKAQKIIDKAKADRAKAAINDE